MSKSITLLTMMVDAGHKELLPDLERELKRRLLINSINLDLYQMLYKNYFEGEENKD